MAAHKELRKKLILAKKQKQKADRTKEKQTAK